MPCNCSHTAGLQHFAGGTASRTAAPVADAPLDADLVAGGPKAPVVARAAAPVAAAPVDAAPVKGAASMDSAAPVAPAPIAAAAPWLLLLLRLLLFLRLLLSWLLLSLS